MLRLLAAMLIALGTLAPAAAQDAKDFPNRAIRIVVPFPAGGPADVAARIIAQKMSEDWGQPVIVENRSGGNTVIGAQLVAKAAPDGYTLLMAINSTLMMNQFLYRSLPYDPFKDFEPITSVTKTVSVLAVPGDSGPKSVKELIERAKAAPGKLNYGAGTITAQLMGYRFHKAAGLDIVYVPFKGTAETRQRPAHRQRPADLCRQRHGQSADRGAARCARSPGSPGSPATRRPRPRTCRRSPRRPACRTSRTCRSGSAWSRPEARRSRSSSSCSRRWRRSWPTRRCASAPSAPAAIR